jgi:polyisoprenoid-binding protein YceI
MATWSIDPVHSSVEFSLEYMGISTWQARFKTAELTLDFDPAAPARASVTAFVDVASIDVTNERLYGKLMEADFFDRDKHPKLQFRSTRVEAAGGNRYRVAGDLTIKGVTRPVVLDATYGGQAKSPFSGKMVAAFRAETRVNRGDFGLQWNAAVETGGNYLGEAVHVTLAIAAVRQD